MLTVKGKILKTLLLSSSYDDTRPALCGVHVLPLDGKIYLEATDGHSLARLEIGVDDEIKEGLIPAAFISDHVPDRKDVTIENDIVNCGYAKTGTGIDTKYPDTVKVVADIVKLKVGASERQFNPALLDRMGKITGGLGIVNAKIRFHGEKDNAVSIEGGTSLDSRESEVIFIGIIMPIRVA